MCQIFKRIISVLTVALLTFLCSFSVSALAPFIEIKTSTINGENEFDATVIISNNPGFAAFHFVIEFDSAFMRPTFIECGYALYDGTMTTNIDTVLNDSQSSSVTIYFVNNVNIVGDGELLKLGFKISDDAIGTSAIKLICEAGNFINQYSDDLEADFIEGTITVQPSAADEPDEQEITPAVPEVLPPETPSPTSRPSDGGGGIDDGVVVSYETNGGSDIPDTIVNNGFILALPPAPIKEEFSFAGWYLDAELTQEYDFNTAVTKSFTLYAKWTEGEMESLLPLAWENPFSDVKESDWFYGHIEYAVINGLFNGMSATMFDPNTAMSRAMFVTVLYRMQDEPTNIYSNLFTDVDDNAYYVGAVKWAAANGIVNGVGNSLFAPDEEITREQMAAILYRYEQLDENIPPDIFPGREFFDWSEVSDYAKNPVNTLVKQGIINGKPDNLFDPKGTATRAEVAAILHRFKESVNEKI